MNPLTQRLINLTGSLINAMKDNSVPIPGKSRYWFQCLSDADLEIQEVFERAQEDVTPTVEAVLQEFPPEWVVNNKGELGVKISDRFFFMYKGKAFEYGESVSMYWRPVGKREFGESGRIDEMAEIDPNKFAETSGEHDWFPLPRPPINQHL